VADHSASGAAQRPRRLVLVAGTGTEIGKTWISVQLLRAWRAAGLTVAARKPAQSFAPDDATTDAELLAEASGEQPDDVCTPARHYEVPMAPPMAAAALGRPAVLLENLVAEQMWPAGVDVGLVETAGGLRSPQADDGDVLDLARALHVDVVVLVADAGLGTVHAVRSCADALEHAALPFVVILNRYEETDALHQANLAWLHDRDGIAVRPWTDDEGPRIAAELAGTAVG